MPRRVSNRTPQDYSPLQGLESIAETFENEYTRCGITDQKFRNNDKSINCKKHFGGVVLRKAFKL